jgi:hypothetical protein
MSSLLTLMNLLHVQPSKPEPSHFPFSVPSGQLWPKLLPSLVWYSLITSPSQSRLLCSVSYYQVWDLIYLSHLLLSFGASDPMFTSWSIYFHHKFHLHGFIPISHKPQCKFLEGRIAGGVSELWWVDDIKKVHIKSLGWKIWRGYTGFDTTTVVSSLIYPAFSLLFIYAHKNKLAQVASHALSQGNM